MKKGIVALWKVSSQVHADAQALHLNIYSALASPGIDTRTAMPYKHRE